MKVNWVDMHNQAFVDGFAVAVSNIVRLHDEPTVAASVIADSGLLREHFKYVIPRDRKIIYSLFRTESQLEHTK